MMTRKILGGGIHKMAILFTPNWHNIAFYSITFLWVLEFILVPSQHSSSSFEEKRSFGFILGAIVLIILVTGFWILLEFELWYQAPPLWVQIIGLLVYAFGLMFRYWSIKTLGTFFTRNVSVEENQTLISHGPYALFRHPAYVGLFLLGIATPLYFGHVPGLILGIILMGCHPETPDDSRRKRLRKRQSQLQNVETITVPVHSIHLLKETL